MRSIPASLEKKLASRVQAKDTSLKANLWVGRPTTPLTEDRFLEKQTVLNRVEVTKTSIAVSHPRVMRGVTEIYLGYIESGIAKIINADYKDRMSHHKWFDTGFSAEADDIALCFDGTMPEVTSGNNEFITNKSLWVFWTKDGVLYGKVLGSDKDPIILAEANCIAVSAVRAMHSEIGRFDFGLIVFFLLAGNLYYRQLINGEWTDAELVTFSPAGGWSDLAAFRTWDYRVGVQLISPTVGVYELFTQFMGIGKQHIEHVQFNDVSEEHSLTEITRTDTSHPDEHVEVSDVIPAPYRFAYELGAVSFTGVKNVDDGTGDWGRYLVLSFDKELNPVEVQEQILQFSLVDSLGVSFYPESVFMDITGRFMTLVYTSFNNAVGECTITYTPGVISTMVGEVLPGFSATFTPASLVPVEGLPVVQTIWNE